MNIVQLHERVRFWLDAVATVRFETEDIDNALNVAIQNKVRESFDNNLPLNRSDSFQAVQRVRDELGPIVKKYNNSVSAVLAEVTAGSLHSITLNSSNDFGWMLSLRVQSGTSWYPAFPLTLNRRTVVSRNPFRRVRNSPQAKVYYYEEQGTWKIEHAFSTLTDFEMYYLALPATVNWGIEYGPSKVFATNDQIITTEETVYNFSTHPIGTKLTILGGLPSIVSGAVVHGFTECNLRSTTHEEISRRAAINTLMTAGQFDKAKTLREEIVAS